MLGIFLLETTGTGDFPWRYHCRGSPPSSGTAKDSPLETLLQGISPGDTTAGDFRKTAHLSQFTLSSVSTEITKGERSWKVPRWRTLFQTEERRVLAADNECGKGSTDTLTRLGGICVSALVTVTGNQQGVWWNSTIICWVWSRKIFQQLPIHPYTNIKL